MVKLGLVVQRCAVHNDTVIHIILITCMSPLFMQVPFADALEKIVNKLAVVSEVSIIHLYVQAS